MERQLPRSLYYGIESYEYLHKKLIADARNGGYKIFRDSGGKKNADGSVKFSNVCPKYNEDIKKTRVL